MTDWDIVEPSASPIFESMRAFGYSPQAAIADIIDNSITAKSSEIHLSFIWNKGESCIIIKDDGVGMDSETLISAMRLGSQTPREARAADDLGRFGLGLKTASISQARELTVVSQKLKSSIQEVRRWDLDEIESTGEWRLRRSMPVESAIPEITFKTSGTAVIWTKCDRLESSLPQFNRLIASIESHIALVFHRFLTGRNKIIIWINGNKVTPIDPFLSLHPSTYGDDEESLPFEGSTITIKPYILPHKNKLSAIEYENVAGTTGWNAGQGFYVYRANRLLVAGSWLGVGGSKEEHTKLARISLDIPPTLDHKWQVDVKKSSIRLPAGMIPDLKRIASRTRAKAQEHYRFRGKAVTMKSAQKHIFGWVRKLDAQGNSRFLINRENPLISGFIEKISTVSNDIELILKFIEETIPINQIALELSQNLDVEKIPFDGNVKSVEQLLRNAISAMPKGSGSPVDLIQSLSVIEPFNSYPEVIAIIFEELESV